MLGTVAVSCDVYTGKRQIQTLRCVQCDRCDQIKVTYSNKGTTNASDNVYLVVYYVIVRGQKYPGNYDSLCIARCNRCGNSPQLHYCVIVFTDDSTSLDILILQESGTWARMTEKDRAASDDTSSY